MRQCRQHGTKLPDGTPIGHYWDIVEVMSQAGRRIHWGTCRHCGKRKRFAHNPQPRTVETYSHIIR